MAYIFSLTLLKNRIQFIINPISGGKSKINFPVLADKYLDTNKFHSTYVFTERIGHASELAITAVNNGIEIIVAVGGDGTINEVASSLVGTNSIMGIIPCGSGNGLARSLGIPLNEKKALVKLNNLNTEQIDSGSVNGKKFFNIAGVGFDAHISAMFAQSITRGLRGYVKTTFQELSNYQSQHYRVYIDGILYEREAFMISIANSSQFGNNAHISPFASLKDGLLDVCIIKPFPMYSFPLMGIQMFNKTAHKSKFVEIIKGKEIKIIRESAAPVHLDGEPENMASELHVTIKPLSLTVLN
ncbi:MAG: diacylglycerol kinase family lipid kinase [Daejeonella sp.]|nr:diacylglycerol kinase family lipid kinase [Daejeonella sp.]